MLTVETATCRPSSRRDFLRLGTLSLGGFSLAHAAQLQAAVTGHPDFVKGKSVVLLYLSGGASQIETFDPKMDAPAETRSVTGEIATSLPGITFGGTFQRLARHAHRMAVLRSFGHTVGSHAEAHVHVLSGGTDPQGRQQGGFSIGSCCTRLQGANHPETGMPSYALLTEEEIDRQFRKELTRVRSGSWPGSLGALHAPLEHQIGWQDEAPGHAEKPIGVSGLVADMKLTVSPAQFQDRMALLRAMDGLRHKNGADEKLASLDKYSRQAVDLVMGKAAAAFSLRGEDEKTVARYDTSSIQIGHNQYRPSTLGRQMLLARRLVEAGCGFITVHSAGWDMHADGNNPGMLAGMERLGTSLDIAVAAFLDDVAARGLSEDILLVITGDFGRTPKLNKRGGRDHWAKLSPLAFAGGGLQMGQVIGKSSRNGAEPTSDPYTTRDLMATVLHTLFDHSKVRLTQGLPAELTRRFDQGQRIRELF